MKKLLVTFLVLFSLLFVTQNISAQVKGATFDFCTGVTSDGKPLGTDTKFDCIYQSCYIYGLLHLPYTTTAKYVIYDVYYVDTDYSETYYDSYTFFTGGQSWDWVWQKVTVSYTGVYVVYIYTKQHSTSDVKYIGKSYFSMTF